MVLYWAAYVLCWTAYPVLQSYASAGDFTVCERMRSALKENLIFYVICGVVLGIALILVTINRNLGSNPHQVGVSLSGVAIAASNAWGLFILICLLGYGLVEIPKRLWRQSNRDLTLRYYQFQAVSLKEGYENAKRDMDATLKLVKKYSERVPQSDPFRPYVNVIISKCPIQYRDITHGDGDAELTWSALVSLNKRVNTMEHDVNRAKVLYHNLLRRAYRLEDIIKARHDPEHVVRWSFSSPRSHCLANQINFLEWLWKVYFESLFLKLLALFCAALSLVVVWSETVFGIPGNISIFALVLRPKTLTFTLQWILVFVPVGYMCACAYWTLFQIRLFNYYRLVDHHQTDEGSLFFSASYLCRLVAPLAYNYLMIIEKDTAFIRVMKPMTLAGDFLFIYFPIFLVVLCVANLLNLYTRFVKACCLRRFSNRFVFDEQFSVTQIERGREILAKERESMDKSPHTNHNGAAKGPRNQKNNDHPTSKIRFEATESLLRSSRNEIHSLV